MLAAFLGFLSLWYPLIFGIAMIAFFIWYFHNVNKYWNSPEMVRERNKAAYEAAHAYKEGKCCCGGNQD